MGRLTYEATARIDLNDRTLYHLQQVITTKLRRGESFHLTWADAVGTGGGRTAVWLHPDAKVTFKYHGGRTPSINRAWVDLLAVTANTPDGLRLLREPAPYPDRPDAPIFG